MANTTCEAIVEALEAHIVLLRLADMKSTADRYVCVFGDDLDALNAVERERAFMLLPQRGPVRKGPCVEWI